jgi:Protein of unknown function (DUF2026)
MKTTKTTQRLIIPMPDYVRIFRVMRAVIERTDADSNEASLFFSMTGAAILRHFYKKEARVLVGAAFFLVDQKSHSVLSFAKSAGGEIEKIIVDSDRENFHCWLECEDQIIDFQALAFPEALVRMGNKVRIPRQMFQKQKAAMSPSHESLEAAGDFYLQPNIALTNELVRAFFASPLQMDLMRGCMKWFTRPPKKISGGMSMQDSEGGIYEMALGDIEVTGAW